jgi:hypothetical protein
VAVNSSDERDLRERQSPLGEIIDGAVRRLSTSIAIAGALIALAIYARPGPPRFQAFATPAGIVRIDMRSGTVIGCEAGRCMTLLRRGQPLAPNPNRNPKALAPPAATPAPQSGQKALPSPAAAPALPTNPVPEPEPAPAPAKQ